jgi:hypothetical protein
MHRGDAASFQVVALASDGVTPVDLTGATLWFTAKPRRSDADNAAGVIQKTSASGAIVITDAPAGQARVDLAAADTSGLAGDTTLWWDAQAKVGGRDRTLAHGRLFIRADVTRAT